MKQVTAEKLRVHTSAIIDEAIRGNPTVITRHGRPVAAVIDARELEELQRLRRAMQYQIQFDQILAGDYITLEDLDRAWSDANPSPA
jgi:prevent-host-death family protein